MHYRVPRDLLSFLMYDQWLDAMFRFSHVQKVNFEPSPDSFLQLTEV